MSYSHTKPCNIDPSHIDQVCEYLAQFGITQFFYGIISKAKVPSSQEFNKLRRRRPLEMLKAKRVICSSPSILEYRHSYLQYFAASDEGYLSKQHMGPNIFKEVDTRSLKGQQFQRLNEEHGIRSRMLWLLPIKYHSDWQGGFVFFSELSTEMLKQTVMANQAKIDHQLTLYSCLFNDRCIEQLNPISNFNCLSSKALQVLELTAQGYSSEEIGEHLVISESGVNYHQNRLKELFNAKNRAQLVSFAHTLGVLD